MIEETVHDCLHALFSHAKVNGLYDGRHYLFRPPYTANEQDGREAARWSGGGPSTAQYYPSYQYYAHTFAASYWDCRERRGLTLPSGLEREEPAPQYPLSRTPPWRRKIRAFNLDASAPTFVPRDTGSRRLPSGGVSLDWNEYIPPPPPPPPDDDIPPPPPTPPSLEPACGFTAINQQTLPERPRTNVSLRKGSLYREATTRPRKQATQRINLEHIPKEDLEVSPKRPEPSPSYRTVANNPDSIITRSALRKLLIVLDLNGTLLHRPQIGDSKFNARPHVDKFLKYIFDNHHIMIWSSATPKNVRNMAKKLLNGEQLDKLIACWGRDTLRLSQEQYTTKVQVYKQLQWVWSHADIQAKNPSTLPWNQINTVLIDDSKEKAASEPFNLVQIEEFEGRMDQMSSDVLGQVVHFLERLRSHHNVSAAMRLNPFRYHDGFEFDWTTFKLKEAAK